MSQTAAVDLFEEVKARLSITEAVTAYGVHIRRDKALCPFHKEDTPSFTVYPATNTWYCFGCGIGGSVIDFAARYYGMEPLEAAKQLDSEFHLGLADQELTPEQKALAETAREAREQEKRLVQDYESWEDAYFIFLCDAILELERVIEGSEPLSDPWAFALNRKLILEYHQELITGYDDEDKISLFRTITREGAVD